MANLTDSEEESLHELSEFLSRNSLSLVGDHKAQVRTQLENHDVVKPLLTSRPAMEGGASQSTEEFVLRTPSFSQTEEPILLPSARAVKSLFQDRVSRLYVLKTLQYLTIEHEPCATLGPKEAHFVIKSDSGVRIWTILDTKTKTYSHNNCVGLPTTVRHLSIMEGDRLVVRVSEQDGDRTSVLLDHKECKFGKITREKKKQFSILSWKSGAAPERLSVVADWRDGKQHRNSLVFNVCDPAERRALCQIRKLSSHGADGDRVKLSLTMDYRADKFTRVVCICFAMLANARFYKVHKESLEDAASHSHSFKSNYRIMNSLATNVSFAS